jgi:hypothetical protein
VCLAVIAALVACAQFLPGTSSSFTATTSNSGSTARAAADWTAPTVGTMAIQKAEGGIANTIRQGGTFYVYANASDSGNPASGVASLSADVSSIATVASTSLTAGSYTVGGTAYAFRSPLLTAKATITSGNYSYSATATDSAGNGPGSASSGTVAVDNTAFAGADFSWDDSGATPGKFESGETVTWYFNKTLDPISVVGGWDGSAQSVSVVVADAAAAGTTQDAVGVYNSAHTTLLPFGVVQMAGDFVAASKYTYFNNSTMTQTTNSVSITLGTPDVAANLKTATATGAPSWAPNAGAFDAAGNASSTASTTTFAASTVTTANKTGGTAGKPEAGDTISYAFANGSPAPASILSGWSGASTPVTVRFTQNGTTDLVTVLSGSTTLPLGSVNTNGDFVSTTDDFTSSSMVLSGNTITIALGTVTTASFLKTDTTTNATVWTPNTSATDLYGCPVWPKVMTATAVRLF